MAMIEYRTIQTNNGINLRLILRADILKNIGMLEHQNIETIKQLSV
jgi:hypothetical protein